MTSATPDNLAAIVFRALYRDFDLITVGVVLIVVPKGTPLLTGDSLGDIARRISAASAPAPGAADRDESRQAGMST